MFIEQFTEKSREIIILSRQEAIRLGHEYLDTEHLLLSLLTKNCTAVKIIKGLGLNDIEGLYKEVEKRVFKPTSTDPNRDIPFTENCKKVLEFSIEEANASSHSKVGTGHILLGIIKLGKGIAYDIFEELSITLKEARQEFINTITSSDYQEVVDVKTPVLCKFSHDLTERARNGKLDPVIGRDRELERLIQILCRRTKNNPVLIGEPGVGKTAIAEGLAQLIVNNKIPSILKNKKVVSLDLGLLVSGTKYRGQFEERITALLEELSKAPNIILFIDELHVIIGAGDAEGSLDASNLLKPALARGDLQCIGATTSQEYKLYIENSGALERRFQPISVEPTDVDHTIEIINGLKDRYEKFHGVKFEDDAITQAVYLSDNYISDRHFPDKAIDVLDEAACYAKLKTPTIPKENYKSTGGLEEMRKNRNLCRRSRPGNVAVSVEDVAHVITSWTGIPVRKMNELETSKIGEIENEISKVVIGQKVAVKTISDVVKRSKIGLRNEEKPIGSFIFLGPSGVGKTELSKCLAEYLFGRRDAIIQLDMSEYNQSFSVSKLVGSPPGYVGYEEGGQLTERVRRKPHSIILVDELEKAHPEVLNIFLQILEYGHVTDGKGRKVNFKNTIIIMTSNIGKDIHKEKPLGFRGNVDESECNKTLVREELKRQLPVEFLNRVDSIVVFNNLSKEDIYKIIDIKMQELNGQLESKNMTITLEPEAKEWLLNNGFSEEYGARFLNRCIDENIRNAISDGLVKCEFKEGDSLSLACDSGGIKVFTLESSLV